MTEASDGRAGIDAALVRRLIAAQFPPWAGLPVTPVAIDGWDNRTYRLGDDLSVRLPTHERYVAGIAKEDRWLPYLAPRLPLPIPTVVGTGRPGAGYPFPWSVRRWIDGSTLRPDRVDDLVSVAADLAVFLNTLRTIDATGGPEAGAHCFYRGAPLHHYDEETHVALARLSGLIDSGAAIDTWEAALADEWTAGPVWFHGDVAVNNLLVRDGRLAAVIDFGTCGVGDPACDLVIAWTLFSGQSRHVFRDVIALDDATWARARGWALWKALTTLAGAPGPDASTLALVADLTGTTPV